MKNADIKARMRLSGIEWVEVATYLKIPMKDLVRRLNSREVSPVFRRKLMQAIDVISRRSEFFYDENR